MTPRRLLAGPGALRRWVRFNLVGALGVVVQLAALTVFSRILGIGSLLATALAVEAALLHNFLWHERFTWAACASHTGDFPGTPMLRPAFRRLLAFNLSNGAISVAGNLAFVWLLTRAAHLPLLPANLAAIGGCGVLNFLVSDRVVFRPQWRGVFGALRLSLPALPPARPELIHGLCQYRRGAADEIGASAVNGRYRVRPLG